LLALLKDLDVNYFEGNGTHEERLSRCQFARQIRMIPGLVEHLRRMIIVFEMNEHFELRESIPADLIERRKMMYKLFKKFTGMQTKTDKIERIT